MSDAPPPKARPGNPWGTMAAAGSALTGPLFVGILLDWQLGWTPWGTLGGVVLGLVSCIVSLIRLMKS